MISAWARIKNTRPSPWRGSPWSPHTFRRHRAYRAKRYLRCPHGGPPALRMERETWLATSRRGSPRHSAASRGLPRPSAASVSPGTIHRWIENQELTLQQTGMAHLHGPKTEFHSLHHDGQWGLKREPPRPSGNPQRGSEGHGTKMTVVPQKQSTAINSKVLQVLYRTSLGGPLSPLE